MVALLASVTLIQDLPTGSFSMTMVYTLCSEFYLIYGHGFIKSDPHDTKINWAQMIIAL